MTLLGDECCAGDKCLLTTLQDVTIANTSVETSFRDGFLGLGYLPAWRIRPGTAVAIDTRSDLLVDATYQWTTASASNSVTSNVFVIQTNT